MSYIEVMQQVKKKQIAPVYLIYGTESYFIQQLKERISKQILSDDQENLSTYDLEETPIQEVITDLETYPFFGEHKLIIATNPVFFKAKPDSLSFEHDLAVLEQYLSMPVDYSTLVVIAPYDKIDERKKISKVFKKQATVAICNPVKDYELTKWIKSFADELKITITDNALEIFETELAANLQLMESEMKKLSLYVGEGGTVTKEVAEDLIAHTSNSSSLRLVDAVIDRDLHKAIAIYKDLEKMKEEPIALIGLLAYQFRMILRVKLLKLKGYSQSQMQKQLAAHPYVIKIALSREKQFSVKRLETIMDMLTEADATMKQGGMEKGLTFELLLYDLVVSKLKN